MKAKKNKVINPKTFLLLLIFVVLWFTATLSWIFVNEIQDEPTTRLFFTYIILLLFNFFIIGERKNA